MRRNIEIGNLFEQKKWAYFIKLAARASEWLKLHSTLGELWTGKNRAERWTNVSQHCLVEGARAEILADLLKLSTEVKEQLFAAAILHDFNKKQEIEYTATKERTVESFDEIYEISRQKLLAAGVDDALVELADSVGHASCEDMQAILAQESLGEYDIARLAMHYLDDYTLNSEWVTTFDGQKNDLDRRFDANDVNPKYAKIYAAGRYDLQRKVGGLVEEKLAELIKDRSHQTIDPKLIPETIDTVLRKKIESLY